MNHQHKNNARSWWKTEGFSTSGGWHPLNARIRAGGVREDEEELYELEYSEERVLALKKQGTTVIIGQFDRGLGESDHREEVENAKKLAVLCHKHGIRHGCYMANTVYYESMLKDHPECEDWVVHTHDGRFVHYGGEQTWRWVACFNSPGWRERMKKQIELAVKHVETDLLHFDNLVVWPEPDSCHCEHCQKKFREYLTAKYPDQASQKKRFGFTGFDTFRIPNFYLRFIQPWELDRIKSPLLQEWILFRCHTVTDYIQKMAKHARSLSPGVAICSNGQSVWGLNQAFVYGVDSTAQAEHVDIVCEENPELRPDEDEDAPLPVTNKIRGMNLHRRLGKTIFTAYHGEESLAFNLTFCGDPGINTTWGYAEPRDAHRNPPQDGVEALLGFWRNHRELYANVKPLARTAVWRNQRTLSWISTTSHLSACVIEQILFNRRIPFGIIQDQWLTNARLKNFDLLIAPNVEFVTDEQVEAIARFVAEGGALLITENSGTMNEWGRIRKASAFTKLFNGQDSFGGVGTAETANFDPNQQFTAVNAEGTAMFAEYGEGKVAYLPKIIYRYPPRTFKSGYNVHYDGIDSRYWKDPQNVQEIIDALQNVYSNLQPFEFIGFPELRANWLEFEDGDHGCAFIHCGEIKEKTDIPFTLNSESAPTKTELHLPENEKPVPLEWTAGPSRFETILPNVCRLGIIKYSW